MVKGVTRQVVLVRPGEKDFFEQAIFIVRAGSRGAELSPEDLLAQAQSAVDEGRERGTLLPRLLCSLAGAGVVGLVWLLTVLL